LSTHKPLVLLTQGEPNLEHYARVLESEGWAIFATASPIEASILLARRPGSILVAEKKLLPSSFASFLRELRDHAEVDRLVLSSGRDDEELRRMNGTLPADQVLAEPFSFAQLLEAIGASDPEESEETSDSTLRAERDEADRLAALPPIMRVIHHAREFSELERDREALLDRALEVIVALVGARRGSLMLRDPEQEVIRIVRQVGLPELDESELICNSGDSIAARVLLDDEPLFAEDIDTAFPHRPRRSYETSSCMVVPIRDRNATLGVVNLADPHDAEAFSREDLVHVMMLADQLATTLTNAGYLMELQELTVVDPLTQLYNRRHFDRQIGRELERARRYGRPLTLVLMDIDGFKGLNDRNGYSIGDRIIQLVAERIRESFRDSDIVTRWGGDEFAIILPETGHPPEAFGSHRSFIDRVRDAVSQLDFRRIIRGFEGRISLSAGIASFPVDARDKNELFTHANEALKRAKQAGGDRSIVWIADDDEFSAEF
jgi:diguanylate cyclase (GGDEF)-like protein